MPKFLKTVATDDQERQANHDVQNIIDPGPKKILLGRKLCVARQRLVKIDQPKKRVECTDEPFVP